MENTYEILYFLINMTVLKSVSLAVFMPEIQQKFIHLLALCLTLILFHFLFVKAFHSDFCIYVLIDFRTYGKQTVELCINGNMSHGQKMLSSTKCWRIYDLGSGSFPLKWNLILLSAVLSFEANFTASKLSIFISLVVDLESPTPIISKVYSWPHPELVLSTSQPKNI